jgi:A/G-specific adenine glycosylase
MAASSFSKRLLHWFDQHGRKNLPWQKNPTPYRVWVSEVMLQQTQVTTVISYFKVFIKQYPTVQDLASAPIDDVLHLWSGLGYYARARNLHLAARYIVERHNGRLPATLEDLSRLPGIGRSTAGAILSLAFKQRAIILDGNVKRVLARHDAVSGLVNTSQVLEDLWEIADRYTPQERIQDYTQAIMDLGATVCVPREPDCPNCPMKRTCQAYRSGEPTRYPEKTQKSRKMPLKSARLLLIINAQQEIYLEKRPPTGIWGGLWCFPETDMETSPLRWCQQQLGIKVKKTGEFPAFIHTFTHYHLQVHPVILKVTGAHSAASIREGRDHIWHQFTGKDRGLLKKGLPVPASKLLKQLEKDYGNEV